MTVAFSVLGNKIIRKMGKAKLFARNYLNKIELFNDS